jgi:hypothetical protein
MTTADKLRSIRELVTAWLEQPDPAPGQEDSPEAADVICQIDSQIDSILAEIEGQAPSGKERAGVLLEMFHREGLQPARTLHHLNGTTSATWHVDDDDDRCVTLSSSAGSEDYLLVMRDLAVAAAVVLREPRDVLVWVRTCLDVMSARGPRRRG